MKNNLFIALVLVILFLPYAPVMAQDGGAAAAVPSFRDTTLPLPRFASLQGNKTYVRAGPGLRYPIKWIFRKEGLPVEIVQEFDSWRKIRDYEGGEGWVHQSLLSGMRTVMVRGEADTLVPLRGGAGDVERLIARMEPDVVARLTECVVGWCRIEVDGYKGWVARNFLWGIYEDEEFN